MPWSKAKAVKLCLVDRGLYSNIISGTMPTEIGKLLSLKELYDAAPATLCDAQTEGCVSRRMRQLRWGHALCKAKAVRLCLVDRRLYANTISGKIPPQEL